MAWLTETPIGVVRAHLAMLDRLDSEEALTASAAAMVGRNSLLKRDAVRRIVRDWEKRSRPAHERRARKATPADLAALGIVVQKVSAKTKGAQPRG